MIHHFMHALCLLGLSILAFSSLAQERSSRHALIVGVGKYGAAEVPPLDGVPYDIQSALKIAGAMGIGASKTKILVNEQATKAAILNELQALSNVVEEGGRVFIYFSGHGVRWMDPALRGCKEGLYAYDSQSITNEEIAQYTRKISEVSDKLIVMFDSCHSDGVNTAKKTRSAKALPFTPKFFLKGGEGAEACYKQSNVKTRGLLAEATRLGALSENFVQITSSLADEASFDEPGKGGLATQGIRDCFMGRAKDLDGSGAVSMKEIEQCAQDFINEKMKPFPDMKPNHVTVTGNRNIIPVALVRPPPVVSTTAAAAVMMTDTRPPVSNPPTPPTTGTTGTTATASVPTQVPAPPQAPAPAVSTVAALTPPPAAVPAATIAPPAANATPPKPEPEAPRTPVQIGVPASLERITAAQVQGLMNSTNVANTTISVPTITPALASLATLKEIEAQKNPRRKVDVTVNKASLRIAKDPLEFKIRTNFDGHVYLVLLGSDRKSFYVLFPNGLDMNNKIKANTPLSLPRPDWKLVAQGPAGTDQILVLVSDQPRDLSALRTSPPDAKEPFTFALNDMEGRSALVDFFSGRGVASGSESFGARLLSVKEVN